MAARRSRPIPTGNGPDILLPGVWGEWAALVGGVAELARQIEVSERTLRTWAHGTRPIIPAMRRVQQMAEYAFLPWRELWGEKAKPSRR